MESLAALALPFEAPVTAGTQAAENANSENQPHVIHAAVRRDLVLLTIDPALESAVLGLRRKLTLKKFLSMELSKPMFASGSVQATARLEMMKLPGLSGTPAEASNALRAAIFKSRLYRRFGYWNAHRSYFSVFEIFKALHKAQMRNDKIVRDFKRPGSMKRRERNHQKLTEAKVARLQNWADTKKADAAALRESAQKLLHRANELERKANDHKDEIAALTQEVA